MISCDISSSIFTLRQTIPFYLNAQSATTCPDISLSIFKFKLAKYLITRRPGQIGQKFADDILWCMSWKIFVLFHFDWNLSGICSYGSKKFASAWIMAWHETRIVILTNNVRVHISIYASLVLSLKSFNIKCTIYWWVSARKMQLHC